MRCLAAGLVAAVCCWPIAANAAPISDGLTQLDGSISLSLDGQTEHRVIEDPIKPPTIVVPGDTFIKTVKVHNNGPTKGVVKVSAISVTPSGKDGAEFMNDISFIAGNGSSKLSERSDGSATFSLPVSEGEIVEIPVGYSYNKNATTIPEDASVSFRVMYEIVSAENIKGDGLGLAIISDVESGKKPSVGEMVSWKIEVSSKEKIPVQGMSVTSTLNGREIQVDCPPVDEMEPEETVTCEAATEVTMDDAAAGKLEFVAEALATNVSGDVVKSNPVVNVVEIQQPVAPPVRIETGDLQEKSMMQRWGGLVAVFGLMLLVILWPRKKSE